MITVFGIYVLNIFFAAAAMPAGLAASVSAVVEAQKLSAAEAVEAALLELIYGWIAAQLRPQPGTCGSYLTAY